MTFLSLVVRNLVRQRVRTLLTVLGIGIGITTIVALGAVTEGARSAAGDVIAVGGADFMVAQEGAADLSFSTVPEAELATVAAIPGVARSWGVLLHVTRAGGNPFFFVFGVEEETLPAVAPRPTAGRLPRTTAEIALGAGAAADFDVAVGGTVTIDRRDLEVVGVYETAALWESSGAYATLPLVQELARKPGSLTMIYVDVAPGEDAAAVAARIEEGSETLTTISETGEYAKVDQGMRILDGANLAISVLAIVIGAIGVMNTMIMSVFERTREIGILRAVGWSGRRIVRMIVAESLVLCALAGVLGIALGLLASRAILLIPAVSGFLEPVYAPSTFTRAVVVAVGVALAGALYPAIRAVRLSPMEALRYE